MIRAALWAAIAVGSMLCGTAIPAALEWPNLDSWAMLSGIIAGAATIKADRSLSAARARNRKDGK